ncbi:hypothetical protein Pcinc_021627 [Petrolisthes cinctipes]|uniref:Uncharacterized protein n=1 Tax=Petrolisthes cinctipes TaxID=88211 RepID=A0AAE1KH82_PETCI|nr:hypothetical protein Pcinc_021627 [Petrolisthes cinctipes]
MTNREKGTGARNTRTGIEGKGNCLRYQGEISGTGQKQGGREGQRQGRTQAGASSERVRLLVPLPRMPSTLCLPPPGDGGRSGGLGGLRRCLGSWGVAMKG